MLEADLILHVRDIAHPESEVQAENVRAILGELGVGEAGAGRHDRGLEQDRRAATPARRPRRCAQVAARTPRVAADLGADGAGMPALLAAIAAELAEPTREETLRLGFDQGRERAWLFDRKLVRSEVRTEGGYEVAVRWTDRDRSQYRALD